MGRVPDPSWKSGPPEPEHRHSEHAISEGGYDFDGLGVNEAEEVDGEAVIAVRESFTCTRDGCDADIGRTHCYGTGDVPNQLANSVDRVVEHVADHAEVKGIDGGELVLTVDGHEIRPSHNDSWGFDRACFGREEPDVDVHAHMYDL